MVPICSVSCSFGTVPYAEFVLDVQIQSVVWSRYSHYDQLKGTPVMKLHLEAERRNAALLVNGLTQLVIQCPQATIRWTVEREGHLDLSGFIPEESGRQFGEQCSSLEVTDTPAFIAEKGEAI